MDSSVSGSLAIDAFDVRLSDIDTVNIDQLHALSIGVGWPHRAEDWQFLRNVGRGIAASDEIGRVLGDVVSAWIRLCHGRHGHHVASSAVARRRRIADATFPAGAGGTRDPPERDASGTPALSFARFSSRKDGVPVSGRSAPVSGDGGQSARSRTPPSASGRPCGDRETGCEGVRRVASGAAGCSLQRVSRVWPVSQRRTPRVRSLPPIWSGPGHRTRGGIV
jgi:hypothetical protein